MAVQTATAASIADEVRKALREGADGASGIPEEIFWVPKDGVKLVRFLTDFNDAVKIVMHDLWGEMMPQPCYKYYPDLGKCPFHVGKYKTSNVYAWTVYEYADENDKTAEGFKRIAYWKPTTNSPIEGLLDILDANGTITDRDIRIERLPIPGKKGTRYKAKQATSAATDFEGKFRKPMKTEKVYEIMKGLIRTTSPQEGDGENGGEEE